MRNLLALLEIARSGKFRDRPRSAADKTCRIITDALQGTYPSLWTGYHKNDPGTPVFFKKYMVKNLKQALYATLFEGISAETEIKLCADPKCGNFFAVAHKGKIYCKPYCAVKVARRKYYRKTKNKSGKGGKHGEKRR
ncbi:MAG: hypothetical protein WAO55_03000 [Candidatus Manganitrophaceae bacterium]